MLISNSRVWFITGSSQGLGRALLDKILEKNERVIATLRTPSMLVDMQSRYPPEQLLLLRLDVTKPQEIMAAFKKAREHFNRIDVVVNNAGYGIFAEIEGTTDEVSRALFEALFWGPLNISKEAVRFFREVNPPGHGGRILNVGSIAGYVAHSALGLYSSAKFALEGLTEAMAGEMQPEWNIKFVILQPGGIDTNSRKNAIRFPMHPAYTQDSPTRKMIAAIDRAPMIGDPVKAAHAIFDIATVPDPPLRLPLGSLALEMVRDKARTTIEEVEKWATVSRLVNKDAYQPDDLRNMETF